jgi:hypothetical protein
VLTRGRGSGPDTALIAVAHGSTIDHLFSIISGAPIEAAASTFVRLGPAGYHVWSLLQPAPGVRVWRLDGVDQR